MQTEHTSIDRLFDRLDEWRNLPAYRLEHRSDIFFSLYLHDALEALLGTHLHEVIIPEFPVQLGAIKEFMDKMRGQDNQSKKIDYVAFSSDCTRALFIELKTDNGSRRASQDTYLENAKKAGIKKLVSGITRIAGATKKKGKYDHLMRKLESLGQVKRDGSEWRESSQVNECQIFYLQPTIKPEDDPHLVITFEWLADYIVNSKHAQDPLARRFAQSLRTWANVAAGSQ